MVAGKEKKKGVMLGLGPRGLQGHRPLPRELSVLESTLLSPAQNEMWHPMAIGPVILRPGFLGDHSIQLCSPWPSVVSMPPSSRQLASDTSLVGDTEAARGRDTRRPPSPPARVVAFPRCVLPAATLDFTSALVWLCRTLRLLGRF